MAAARLQLVIDIKTSVIAFVKRKWKFIMVSKVH